MRPNKPTNKGAILLFISTILFGSYGVWSKLIGNSFGIFYQGWTRALLIALVLLPLLYRRKELVPIRKRDWKWMSVFLISTSLTQAPIFYAFNHMDIGTASLLFFVGMIITMYAMGFFFFSEKFTPLKIVALALACIGLYAIFSFSLGAFSALAASMALLNGAATGVELSSSKKLTGTYSPLYITWLSWAIIVLTNCAISLALHETQFIPALTLPWAYLALYALASILGFWLAIEGYKHVEASVGGLIGLLEALFGVIFGILVFHELLTAKVVIGGLLIIAAASLPHLAQMRKAES